MSNVNKKNKRHALKGRFVVDAFGPLIDISKLAVFSGIENARTLPERELARELTRRSKVGDPFWDETRVQDVVANALANWSQNDELINLTAVLKLWHASKNGTDVRIVSTTANSDLFITAKRAIEEASEDVSPNSTEAGFEFSQLGGTTGLGVYLKKLDSEERRYTVVLHDSYAMDAGISLDLFDEWYPPATGRLEDLTPIIERGLERELRMAPVGWLSESNSEIKLSEFKAIGDFLVFGHERRKRLREQVARLHELIAGSKKPISVVLCGPSGSGKSFFVEECVKRISGRESAKIIAADLSSVTDVRGALDSHLNQLSASDDGVALLDEVDTRINGEHAYRYLMKPMTGSIVDTNGRTTSKLKGVLWFMAGSIANSKLEWVERCKKQEPKVIDWSNRVSEWIEIPGVRSSDAILQAVAQLLKCNKEKNGQLGSARKTSLLFFALPEWADARELRRVVEDIYDCHSKKTDGDLTSLEEKTIRSAIQHRLDLRKCLREAEGYNLEGNVELVQ